MRFRLGDRVERNNSAMPNCAAVGCTHFRVPTADEFQKPLLISTGRPFSTGEESVLSRLVGLGSLDPPPTATSGLPVPDRRRVTWRPAVSRTAGSGGPARTSATNPIGKKTMRRHGAKNADYRGGVTCLYDTQLLGACLHASESGGRSRPEAVRGMPDVPIAPPATGPPEGWAAFGFVSPASFNRGLWARLLRVLGS